MGGLRGLLRVLLGGLVVAGVVLWLFGTPLLARFGRLMVVEDPLAPADAIVVSQASGRADAFEGARLYAEGLAPRVVMTSWIRDPLDEEVRGLGIPFLSIPDLARAILEKSGVPPSAIVQLPDRADGSETEVAAVARWVLAHGVRSLIYVAPRSHGARIRWMMQRRAPGVRVVIRAPRTDGFVADGWWRSREQSRELLIEAVRWINSAVFGDAWKDETAGAPAGR